MTRRAVPGLCLVLFAVWLPASAGAADADIGFKFTDYVPPDRTIQVGERITWTPIGDDKFDNHPLAAASGQGLGGFGKANGKEPYSYTFAKAGTYVYYCTFHGSSDGKGMAGKITVIDPADPGPTPDPSPSPSPAPTPAPSPGSTVTAPSQERGVRTSLSFGKLPARRIALRRGIPVALTADGAGAATVLVRLGGRVVARSARVSLEADRRRTVRARFTEAGRRIVARRRGRLTLRVSVTLVPNPAGAERVTVSRRVRLR